MKDLFKYIGIFSLFIFSLIYTNRVADIMKSKTSIMRQIKSQTNTMKTQAVDAIVDGDYIIPGLNGLAIDEDKSYSKMMVTGGFDEDLFVYKEIAPAISLNDNLEKIIKKANKLKRAVAIIINDQSLLNYFIEENIKVDYLIDSSNIIKSDKLELINNETDSFYKIESFLNKNNYNHNICVLNGYNDNICRKEKKYLIIPTYTINNSNMTYYISEIDSGDILMLNSISVDNVKVLISKIKYRDLNIIYLSELISENNNYM